MHHYILDILSTGHFYYSHYHPYLMPYTNSYNCVQGTMIAEICNINIPLPFPRGVHTHCLLSSAPHSQDLSCVLMHGSPLYIALSPGPGESQVIVIHLPSALHGSQLLWYEVKITHSQQSSMWLASFSLLPLFLSVSLFLLPSKAGAAIPVSSRSHWPARNTLCQVTAWLVNYSVSVYSAGGIGDGSETIPCKSV